jgi:hypothetical protein
MNLYSLPSMVTSSLMQGATQEDLNLPEGRKYVNLWVQEDLGAGPRSVRRMAGVHQRSGVESLVPKVASNISSRYMRDSRHSVST